MFAGTAIDDGIGAAGIIADHPADHGPVGCGGLRAEKKTVWSGERVQLVADDTGLHAYPAFFCIQFEDFCKIFGDIHYDPVAHHLTGQRGPGRAGNQGGLFSRAKAMSFLQVGIDLGTATARGISL